jgi:hypothetical protein
MNLTKNQIKILLEMINGKSIHKKVLHKKYFFMFNGNKITKKTFYFLYEERLLLVLKYYTTETIYTLSNKGRDIAKNYITKTSPVTEKSPETTIPVRS